MSKFKLLFIIVISVVVIIGFWWTGVFSDLNLSYSDKSSTEPVVEREDVQDEPLTEREKEKSSDPIIERNQQTKEGKESESVELPLVAVVIDDLGNHLAIDKSIDAISADLTLAVLPFRDHTEAVIDHFSGRQELILHLPMEPIDKGQREDEMLLVDMDRRQIEDFLDRSFLEAGSFIQGANNHKGSLFTADRSAMIDSLNYLKKQQLYFFDSYTTGESVAYSIARELGVKAAKRDVFLDNSRQPEDIRAQLIETVELAEKQGQAIAIGHSVPETIEVLSQEIPKLKKRVKFVPVSYLVR